MISQIAAVAALLTPKKALRTACCGTTLCMRYPNTRDPSEKARHMLYTMKQAFADMCNALLGRSDLKDAVTNELGSLFDSLHLFAHSHPCRFVPTFGFVDVSFSFSHKHFEVFILLHQK